MMVVKSTISLISILVLLLFIILDGCKKKGESGKENSNLLLREATFSSLYIIFYTCL